VIGPGSNISIVGAIEEGGTMCRTMISLLVAIPWLTACARDSPPDVIPAQAQSPQGQGTTIHLESPAFNGGGTIPKVHTCDGKGTSPPLAWSGVPEAARSLALILEDPDAPGGTFTHWVLFDMPAETKGLGEGIPPEGEVRLGPGGAAARQGKNDFGKLGYGGPCPPRGTHRYVFLLYALDAPLNLKPGATRDQLLRAMKGHILAEGRLMGRYSR
jgi:Raf kinase inhibitor-like YbhB/YbcL family protein